MRKCLLILGLMFCFASCKKEDNELPPSLTGEWKWVVRYYSSPANTTTPLSTGVDERLRFTNSMTWERSRNGAVDEAGTYSAFVTTGKNGARVNRLDLFLNSGTSETSYYEIVNDTLRISNDLAGIVGGGAILYTKVK